MNRNRMVFGVASLLLAAGLGYAIRAGASGIPSTNALTYAGVLEDANGPITGMHNVQVVLYDAATAGNNLCQTSSTALVIEDGHFSVQLPDACTTATGANPNVWVDVLVDGSDTGRTKIGAVPYAVEANHAPKADNATNAGHASTADTATNATNATNATKATTSSGLASGAHGGLSFYEVAGSALSLGGTSGVCTVDANQFSANCTCPSGQYVISGGAYSAGGSGLVIGESRPVSTTTWRVTCGSASPAVAGACGAYELVCSNLAP